jgi:hypothetical protein
MIIARCFFTHVSLMMNMMHRDIHILSLLHVTVDRQGGMQSDIGAPYEDQTWDVHCDFGGYPGPWLQGLTLHLQSNSGPRPCLP